MHMLHCTAACGAVARQDDHAHEPVCSKHKHDSPSAQSMRLESNVVHTTYAHRACLANKNASRWYQLHINACNTHSQVIEAGSQT